MINKIKKYGPDKLPFNRLLLTVYSKDIINFLVDNQNKQCKMDK